MKVYASISGGKDSLAALITHMERGGQCDGAIYCRIMFDDETSAEVPEHEEWLHSKCFPLLEREYGIKTQIVQGKYTYTDCFYKQYEKGGKVGKIWGFPFLRGAWCNTRLKVRPIQAHIKTLGEFTEIVGIAADETKRIERKTVAGKILPLVECGITEAQAEGCEHVVTEPWAKDIISYRCFAPGRCKGRVVGVKRFDPHIPAWCPKLERSRENG